MELTFSPHNCGSRVPAIIVTYKTPKKLVTHMFGEVKRDSGMYPFHPEISRLVKRMELQSDDRHPSRP